MTTHKMLVLVISAVLLLATFVSTAVTAAAAATAAPYHIASLPGIGNATLDNMYTGYLPIDYAYESQVFYRSLLHVRTE